MFYMVIRATRSREQKEEEHKVGKMNGKKDRHNRLKVLNTAYTIRMIDRVPPSFSHFLLVWDTLSLFSLSLSLHYIAEKTLPTTYTHTHIR